MGHTLDPVTVSLHPLAVAAKAPHANSAKLFIDFLLSREGQQLVLAIGRTPSGQNRHQNAGEKSQALSDSARARRALQPIPERIP